MLISNYYGYQSLLWKSVWRRTLCELPGTIIFPQRHGFMTRNPRDEDTKIKDITFVQNDLGLGPSREYDSRVATGHLRNDKLQRGIVKNLQRLHDELQTYDVPLNSRSTFRDPKLQCMSLRGRLLDILLRHKDIKNAQISPRDVPKGLYLYGDVGSGKTMLMDLFYETLPTRIASKTRLHFHNFMQDVHKKLHKIRLEHGSDIDGIPFLTAEIAEKGNILCFDEFQCTDVADAMILRRLLEALMNLGVVLVTTSNRHPDDLYRNGIQRESFIPCIDLLKNRLDVINLNSDIDYRKIPCPSSNVYHTPLDSHAISHAESWFKYLGDSDCEMPHSEIKSVWGRKILVPKVSGRVAMFSFDELIGRPMSAADYIELTKSYDAFIVTNTHGMTYQERDLARRFITFIDAVYEAKAMLVLTSAVELQQLFLSKPELNKCILMKHDGKKELAKLEEVDDSMRNMMDDLNMKMEDVKKNSIFTGDEETFAFSRALSRLSEMGSQEWVNRILLKMNKKL